MGTKSTIATNSLFTLGNIFYLFQMLFVTVCGVAAIWLGSIGIKLVGVVALLWGGYCVLRVLREIGRGVRNIHKPGEWR